MHCKKAGFPFRMKKVVFVLLILTDSVHVFGKEIFGSDAMFFIIRYFKNHSLYFYQRNNREYV